VLQRVRLGDLANGIRHFGSGGREMPGEESNSGERRGRRHGRRSGSPSGGRQCCCCCCCC
jgi:hypothetical protein